MPAQPTLVVLAAGLGSRYGGDKQIAQVGPHGETFLDYTLHDAARAGFGAVVAVVRPVVAGRVGALLARSGLPWRLVEQPCPRPRPWGTAHALACAMAATPGAVGVVNADDWYGGDALPRLRALLAGDATAALVAHHLGRTLSPSGPVNRGVCAIGGGLLTGIRETTGLQRAGDLVAHPSGLLPADTPVSLNLWGFGPAMAGFFSDAVDGFIAQNHGDEWAEIGIPDVVAAWIAGGGRVRAEVCAGDWCGLTHAADQPLVAARLRAAIAAGDYPAPLPGVRHAS